MIHEKVPVKGKNGIIFGLPPDWFNGKTGSW